MAAISKEAAGKLQAFRKEHSKARAALENVDKRLEKHVRKYIKQTGADKRPDDLFVIITLLPPGIVRFKMFELYYDLCEQLGVNQPPRPPERRKEE